jgi:PIN domain nuclease of toxin-antitoxin system
MRPWTIFRNTRSEVVAGCACTDLGGGRSIKAGLTQAVTELEDPGNDLLLSAGTVWEIAIKVGLRKLALSQPFGQWIVKAIADLGLRILPISVEAADVQIALPSHHRDPFDRLLVAQSQTEAAILVSVDSVFDQYGVRRLW